MGPVVPALVGKPHRAKPYAVEVVLEVRAARGSACFAYVFRAARVAPTFAAIHSHSAEKTVDLVPGARWLRRKYVEGLWSLLRREFCRNLQSGNPMIFSTALYYAFRREFIAILQI
jgi:hypothetical protein